VQAFSTSVSEYVVATAARFARSNSRIVVVPAVFK
jgi:hypothetical protein